MAKHKTILSILILFLLSSISIAGLSVLGTDTTLTATVKNSSTTYYQQTGNQDGYPYIGSPYNAQTQIECNSSISAGEDAIYNRVNHRKYGYRSEALQHIYTYDSDITFFVDPEETYSHALLNLSFGNFYIDGVLLTAEQDGSFKVPLDTPIIASWDYSYTAPYTNMWSDETMITATQGIQYIGLTGFVNPEPASLGILSLGSLLLKRRKTYGC